jgi:hypothetical protein
VLAAEQEVSFRNLKIASCSTYCVVHLAYASCSLWQIKAGSPSIFRPPTTTIPYPARRGLGLNPSFSPTSPTSRHRHRAASSRRARTASLSSTEPRFCRRARSQRLLQCFMIPALVGHGGVVSGQYCGEGHPLSVPYPPCSNCRSPILGA